MTPKKKSKWKFQDYIFTIVLIIFLLAMLGQVVTARSINTESSTRNYLVINEDDGTKSLSIDGNTHYYKTITNEWNRVNKNIDENLEVNSNSFKTKFSNNFGNPLIINYGTSTIIFKPLSYNPNNNYLYGKNNIIYIDSWARGIDTYYTIEDDSLTENIVVNNYNNIPNNFIQGDKISFDYIISTDYDLEDEKTKTKWNKNNNLESNKLELKKNNQIQFTLREGIAVDKEGKQTKVNYKLSKQGINQILSLQVSKSWMMSASYPVGIDPDLTINNNLTITLGQFLNYGNVTIKNSVITLNATDANGFLKLNATYNIYIENSTITGNSKGYVGGGGGGTCANGAAGMSGNSGAGAGGLKPTTCIAGNYPSGGGGAGNSNTGGASGAGNDAASVAGGSAYGDTTSDGANIGSGGGGGGSYFDGAQFGSQGGRGGGYVSFLVAAGGNITIVDSNITTDGTDAANTGNAGAGGGGGSAADIAVNGTYINITRSTLQCNGGRGGSSAVAGGGGGGSSCHIKVAYATLTNSSLMIIQTVGGGQSGGSSGGAGTYNQIYQPNMIPNNAPSIPALNNPLDNTNFNYSNINFSWYPSNDTEANNINYNITISTSSSFTTLITSYNTTNTSYVYNINNNGTYYWRVRACDDSINNKCSDNSPSRTLYIDTGTIKGNTTVIYTSPMLELSNASFSINATFNSLVIDSATATLVYNNTVYPTTIIASSSTSLNFTNNYYTSIILPLVESSSLLKSFYFNYTINYPNDSTNYLQSGTYNQNVTQVVFTNCALPISSSLDLALNLTFYNEVNNNKTRINLTNFEATFSLYSNSSTGFRRSSSTIQLQIPSTTSAYYCIGKNQQFYTDAIMEYSSTGYDKRNYYLYFNLLSNNTQDIPLYLLPSPLASLVNVHVQDIQEVPLSQRYIFVQRYYIGTDTYETVAGGYTDETGKDSFYLHPNDVYYRFIVQNNNTIELISDRIKITSTDIYLTVQSDQFSDQLKYLDNIAYSLTYNNVTHIFTAVYSDTSGGTITSCLNVYGLNKTSSTNNCNTCSTSNTNTLTCNLGTSPGEGLYKASLKITKGATTKLYDSLMIGINGLSFDYGLDGIVYTIFIILLLVGLMMYNPATAVAGSLAGIIIGFVLGFYKLGSSSSAGYISLVGIILVGGYLISRLRS